MSARTRWSPGPPKELHPLLHNNNFHSTIQGTTRTRTTERLILVAQYAAGVALLAGTTVPVADDLPGLMKLYQSLTNPKDDIHQHSVVFGTSRASLHPRIGS